MNKCEIVESFDILYYDSKIWQHTYWFGIPTQKLPLDLWIYQEIITGTNLDIIIETGTADGGSALFLANMCDLKGKGEVITIDIESKPRPQHNRISYLLGSSISEEIFNYVKSRCHEKKVMVILDSLHNKDYVLYEMRLYWQLVSVGSYLIVEDTNINGHPVYSDFGNGPMEAVEEFLRENKSFVVDKSKEKFYSTWNPSGYLKRI